MALAVVRYCMYEIIKVIAFVHIVSYLRQHTPRFPRSTAPSAYTSDGDPPSAA